MSSGSRLIWVTGAAGGIGSVLVRMLSERGDQVVAIDRPGERLDALTSLPGVSTVAADLADTHALANVSAQWVTQFGGPQVLINNAGVAPVIAPVSGLDLALWEQNLAVNLTAAYVLMAAALPSIQASGDGRVISVSSSSAVRVSPGFAPYSASKAGLIALTKVLALELAPHGGTANVVAPGLVQTAMSQSVFGTPEAVAAAAASGPLANPMGEVILPADVAELILFLISPAARHVSGQTVHCNAAGFMP